MGIVVKFCYFILDKLLIFLFKLSMQQELQEFTISELKPGMYIAQVLEQSGQLKIRTQGLVSTESAIAKLDKQGVSKVLVDLSKSKLSEPETSKQTSKPEESVTTSEAETVPSVPFDKEINQASNLYQQAKTIQSKAFDNMKAGAPIDTDSVQEAATGLIDSVFRNQDALACMTRMRVKNEYLMEHSINVAIIMTIFAKHLKLEQEVIQQLATGAMLMDLGMIAVPGNILNKKGELTPEEREKVEQHVNMGHKVLSKAKGLSPISLEVVQDHHENLDGSGYPNNKTAEQLSLYAKMAKIVDCYDAITADRVYQAAKTPVSAFKILRSESGTSFDPELVNEFIKCMGIHPVGTLVKMKSNKLGIVIKSNPVNPISPSVNVFYSVGNKCYIEPKIVDLSAKGCNDEIDRSVKPEDFKVDMIRFFKEVLLS